MNTMFMNNKAFLFIIIYEVNSAQFWLRLKIMNNQKQFIHYKITKESFFHIGKYNRPVFAKGKYERLVFADKELNIHSPSQQTLSSGTAERIFIGGGW